MPNYNVNSGYGAISAHAGLMGPGKQFIVVNAADTALVSYLGEIYVPDAEGVRRLYVATSLTADIAIQAALDACVANRGDYVIVMPSNTNYSITNSLVMSKKGVHLICPAGLSGDFPVGNTARLKSIVAATPVIAVSANTEAFEIAGFYIKNYADVAAITLATGVSAQNIHHNIFPLVWSAAPVASIVGSGSAGAWGSIERNWFISETGTGVTAAIAAIDIQAQATGCRICHNEVTIGDANTATLCISNQSVKGHTNFNVFSTGGGTGGTGVITNCISIPALEAAIGNRGAVATGTLLIGGTAATSFCDNRDGASGGATPVVA